MRAKKSFYGEWQCLQTNTRQQQQQSIPGIRHKANVSPPQTTNYSSSDARVVLTWFASQLGVR